MMSLLTIAKPQVRQECLLLRERETGQGERISLNRCGRLNDGTDPSVGKKRNQDDDRQRNAEKQQKNGSHRVSP